MTATRSTSRTSTSRTCTPPSRGKPSGMIMVQSYLVRRLLRTLDCSLSPPITELGDQTWGQAYQGGTSDTNNTIQGQVGDFQYSGRKANAVRAYYEWMRQSFLPRPSPGSSTEPPRL